MAYPGQSPFQLPMLEMRGAGSSVPLSSDAPSEATTFDPPPLARIGLNPSPSMDLNSAQSRQSIPSPTKGGLPTLKPVDTELRKMTPINSETDAVLPTNSTAAATNSDLLARRLGIKQSDLYAEQTRAAAEAEEANADWMTQNTAYQNQQNINTLNANTQNAGGYRGGAVNPITGENYDAAFQAAGAKYNIHPGILAAIAQYESDFKDLGANSSGAIGIMQVVGGPRGVASIDKGASMIAALLYDKKQYPDIPYGDLYSALWAYNAGYTGFKKKYRTGYNGEYQNLIIKAAKDRYGWGGSTTGASPASTPGSGVQASGQVGLPPDQWGPNTPKYAGYDAENTKQAKAFIMRTWGLSDGEIGTFSTEPGAHVENSQHYYGKALDVGIRHVSGDTIANWFRANPQAFGLKYVIWQHHRWTADGVDHGYDKSDHFDHVHISLEPGGTAVPTGGAGGAYVPVGPPPDPAAANAAAARAKAAADTAQEMEQRAQLLSRLGGMRLYSGEWR